MAFALTTAHNIISSCCGDAIPNPFSKNDEDQADTTPTPATATAAPTTEAAPTTTNKETKEFSDKDAKYEDLPWAKLPISARKAAMVIGFDQESWDSKKWLPIDDKHWEDLTPEELKACESLGWSKDSWNTKYSGVYWKDLPNVVKRACEKMGWDQVKWDEGEYLLCSIMASLCFRYVQALILLHFCVTKRRSRC
jgi:hypothetical protein